MRIVTIPRTALVVLVSAGLAHAQQQAGVDARVSNDTATEATTQQDPQPVPTGTVPYILQSLFESGFDAGWSASGLWHTTDQCSPPDGVCGEFHWAYFGIDSSCTFDNGNVVDGVLTAPTVHIPEMAPAPYLFYCSNYNGERGMAPTDGDYPNSSVTCLMPSNYDAAWVEIAGESGTYVEDVACRKQIVDEWEKRFVPLDVFAGEDVTVSWHFDSMDTTNNNLTGWMIDKAIIGDGELLLAAESMKDHDGTGSLPIDVINSTEPRTGGLTELRLTFRTEVEAEDGDFSDLDDIVLVGDGAITGVSANDNVLTVSVSGVEDRSCVTFEFPGVVDAYSGAPVQETVSVVSHFGDVNSDNKTDEADVVLAETSSNPDRIFNATQARGDIDLDGLCIVGDVALAKAAQLQEETVCP